MEFFRHQRDNNNDGQNNNGFFMSALAGVGLGAFLMMSFK